MSSLVVAIMRLIIITGTLLTAFGCQTQKPILPASDITSVEHNHTVVYEPSEILSRPPPNWPPHEHTAPPEYTELEHMIFLHRTGRIIQQPIN